MVLYSDPMIYPPMVNAAKTLANSGYLVDIYAKRFDTGEAHSLPPEVRLHYLGGLRKGLSLRLDYLLFCLKILFFCVTCRFEWVFSYNAMAALPGWLGTRFCKTRFCYHNHDLWEAPGGFSFYSVISRLESLGARQADLVTFPQRERAERFTTRAGLSIQPTIVMNCPLICWPRQGLDNVELQRFKNHYSNLVLYQGGLNWKRGLAKVIESIQYWPPDSGLVLVGSDSLEPDFLNQAARLTESFHVEGRVVVLGLIPYEELPGVTRQCCVGLGVLATVEEDESLNIRDLAGASNKLPEYLSCGLPIVVPETAAYADYLGQPPVGMQVDPYDIRKIGLVISQLIDDSVLYETLSSSAKQRFDAELNFEHQFQPVLLRLLQDA
jgi:glycosyltransferase involved in cell wall biosynthesis